MRPRSHSKFLNITRFKNDYLSKSFQIESTSVYKPSYKPSKYERNPLLFTSFLKLLDVLFKNLVRDIKKYEQLSANLKN